MNGMIVKKVMAQLLVIILSVVAFWLVWEQPWLEEIGVKYRALYFMGEAILLFGLALFQDRFLLPCCEKSGSEKNIVLGVLTELCFVLLGGLSFAVFLYYWIREEFTREMIFSGAVAVLFFSVFVFQYIDVRPKLLKKEFWKKIWIYTLLVVLLVVFVATAFFAHTMEKWFMDMSAGCEIFILSVFCVFIYMLMVGALYTCRKIDQLLGNIFVYAGIAFTFFMSAVVSIVMFLDVSFDFYQKDCNDLRRLIPFAIFLMAGYCFFRECHGDQVKSEKNKIESSE